MMLLSIFLFFVPDARAQSDDANKILKTMSDYMASHKILVILRYRRRGDHPGGAKDSIRQFRGHLQIGRPDKIRASRTGGYADVELVFDGKTITVYAKHNGSYAQADAPGSLDQSIG